MTTKNPLTTATMIVRGNDRRTGDDRRINVEHALSQPMPRRLHAAEALAAVQAQRTALAVGLLHVMRTPGVAEHVVELARVALREGGFEVPPTR